ncbi:unnamed protein product [Owenia fusiformis]|uniref:Sex-determining region Y protein n=1 Tax=Owenia fusiformis TaxID=6347 RepID=A0A8J1XIW9_OWEFU|nr:unnamed protein product [Owenia fusiformis]
MENVAQIGLPTMPAMVPEQSQPLPLASNYRLVNGKACKIPRPMNAFMLYAVDHRKILSKQYPKEHNKEISMRLGNMWRELPENAKKRYFDLAKQAELQHRMRYPNYSYNPKPTKKKRSLEGRRDDILMLGPNPNQKDLSELQKSDGVLSSLLKYDSQRQPLVSTQASVMHNTSGGKMIPMQNANVQANGQYMLRYPAPMAVPQGMMPRPQGRMPHPLMMFRGPAPQGMVAVRGSNLPDGRNINQACGSLLEGSPPRQADLGIQMPNQPGSHFQSLKHQGSHFQPVQPQPRSPGSRYAPYPPPRFVYMPCNMAYASKLGWPQDGMQHPSFPAQQVQHFDNNMNPQNSFDNYGGYFQMTDQMFGNLEQPADVNNTTESLSEDDDESNEALGEERSYTDLSNASQDIVYVQDSNNNNAAVAQEDKVETAQATQALLDLVSNDTTADPRPSETVIKWDRATDKYIVSEKHPEIMITSSSFLSNTLNQDNNSMDSLGNFMVTEKQSDVMIPSPSFLNNAVAIDNYPQDVNAAPNVESLFDGTDDSEPFVPQNCQVQSSPSNTGSSMDQASIVKREKI